jgi:hypothetical protein
MANVVEYTAKVLQVSSTKNTLVLNIGSRSEISDNDSAVLLRITTDGLETKTITQVVKLKLVKAYVNESVWIVVANINPDLLKKDEKYFVLTKSQILRGRKEYETTRTTLVTDYDQDVVDQVRDALIGETSDLSMREDQYIVSRILHEAEKYRDEDVNIVDVARWEKDNSSKAKQVTIYRSPHSKIFKTKKRLDTFEKIVMNTVEKTADGFNANSFYRDSMRNGNKISEGESLFRSDLVKGPSESQAYESKRKFYESVVKKGAAWSKDYSDQELAQTIEDLGIMNELYRQQQVIMNRYSYQLYAQMGSNLIQNQTSQDPDGANFVNYDFEVGFETFPLRKIETLRSFSFEGSFRRATNNISIGLFNADVIELSGAFHVNWYPFVPPNAIKENIPYLGILFRYGLASVDATTFGEIGNYAVLTRPGFRGGIKYNFTSGLSLRFTLSFEKILLDRLASTQNFAIMPARDEIIEGKLGFGVMKFF